MHLFCRKLDVDVCVLGPDALAQLHNHKKKSGKIPKQSLISLFWSCSNTLLFDMVLIFESLNVGPSELVQHCKHWNHWNHW